MALREREEIVDQEEIVRDFPDGSLVRTGPRVWSKPWWVASTCLEAKKTKHKTEAIL